MFSVRWHKHILQQNMEYWLVRKKAETIKRGTYLSKEELANVMKKGKINSMYGISCSNVLYSDYWCCALILLLMYMLGDELHDKAW